MSNDITKMYQFINKYGIDKFMKDADENGDNVIIRSEFENFLSKNSYAATANVIDSFWKSVDVNDSEKRIEGTNLKNYRAVTKDEADRIAKIVEYYEELQAFCKSDLKAPANLSTTQQTLWLSDMEAQLNDYYNAFVAGEIDKYNLADKYEELVISITPRHATEDMMRTLKTAPDLAGLSYDWNIDWNLQLGRKVQNQIKKFIKANPNATPEEIVEEAQKVVNGMLINADFGAPYTKGEEAYKFNQNSFTELQQVILDDILISDSEVQGLLAGETPTVIDKLFKRFYNGYFHQELKDFAEQKAGVVEAFKLWFAEYGADVLTEIKADEAIESPEIPETPVTPVTPETPTEPVWNCNFPGVNSSYSLASSEWITISSTISVTKDGVAYNDVTLKLDSWVGVDEFEPRGTYFSMDTDTMAGPRTQDITIKVIDNATTEVIGTKTITLNIAAPVSTGPSNQDIVNDIGNKSLSVDCATQNCYYNYWVGNKDDIIAEDLIDTSLLSFKEMYDNGYNFMVASSGSDWTSSSNAKLGYDDEGLTSYDNMLDYVEHSDYEVAIDNWIINLGHMVMNTMGSKFTYSKLSSAVSNVTARYISDLRAQTNIPELPTSGYYDEDIVEAFSTAVNSKSNKSGYHVYAGTGRYYVGVNFKAFVDDIINEYKRLGGTFS